MGRRLNKYEQVDHLPEKAITVQEYADQLGTSKQNIYNKVRRNKNNNFKIIDFKGINFIIVFDEEPVAMAD